MNTKKDLVASEDIELLVSNFYDKVRADDLIGPIFNRQVGDHWDVHLEKMNRFWCTVLLADHSYLGNPFPLHITLQINQSHFDRWLNLFCGTINEMFSGGMADEAISKAKTMATIFESKLRFLDPKFT